MVLPKMQISQFISGLVLICIINLPAFGQNWQSSWENYLAGRFDKKDLSKTPTILNDDPYYITLSAIYMENADQAREKYITALELAKDEKLILFLQDKLGDYYYANGLYVTAKKYTQSISSEMPRDRGDETQSPIISPPGQYYLQFGVFSNESNAYNFIDMHRQPDLQIKVLAINEKFYVVSGPFYSEEEAQLMKNDVKSRYKKLKPFVKRF